MIRGKEHVSEPILKLESHPFFVGPVPPTYHERYLSFPFYVGINSKYAIPTQIVTDEILHALEKAYSLGSMLSIPLGHSPLSSVCMSEVLSVMLLHFRGDVKHAKFLEIGCGSGDLLNELKIRGASVMGIEIGPQGREGAKKYGFPVIEKPFTPDLIHEKFDCIFSYGCLEHVIDLEEVFIAGRECLKEGGLFFHVVPNGGQFFDQATFDNLYHEHINYFTCENGVRLFESQGFLQAQGYTSDIGNELFLWGFFDERARLRWPGDDHDVIVEESEALARYTQILFKKTARITTLLKRILSAGESVGLYAGGFEYGVLLGNSSLIRYFDGDSYKHGMAWLSGLPLIESPYELKSRPVDHLVICKSHFYNSIVNYLSKEIKIPQSIKTYDLGSL